MSSLITRTEEVFGKDFINTIKEFKYTVVGCGGVGALFAEILIRTGAENICLIDGDTVDESNLNRVISFTSEDIGHGKVDILSKYLKRINQHASVKAINGWLREYDPQAPNIKEVRDSICDSDVVLIAIDRNRYRKICEDLCYEDSTKKVMSIGVFVGKELGTAGYECTWKPRTPDDSLDRDGYGNGSYASIVMEATSVGFAMLLHNLKNPNSNAFKRYYKSYKNFVPSKCIIKGTI